MKTTRAVPSHFPSLCRRALLVAAGLAVTAGAALALGLLAAPSASASTCPEVFAQPFTDVSHDHPLCNEIRVAKVQGWVNGYPDGSFHPSESVTRGAVAATLWNAGEGADGAAAKPCTVAPFLDVPIEHVFCWPITVATAQDLMYGYGNGTFGPSQPITRQETAATLVRFPDGPRPLFGCDQAPFIDVPATSDFCSEIALLSDVGVANGYADGTFKPHLDIPRQELVAMLVRWIDVMDD